MTTKSEQAFERDFKKLEIEHKDVIAIIETRGVPKEMIKLLYEYGHIDGQIDAIQRTNPGALSQARANISQAEIDSLTGEGS